MTREILLNGASFANNFGDILFFQIFSKKVLDSGFQPTMYSTNQVIINQLPYVKFYENRKKAVKNAFKIAYIGGGYLGEQPFSRKIDLYKWGFRNIRDIHIIGLLGIYYKKPIGVFGAGGGKITNVLTRYIVREIIEYANPVIVRDKETKDALIYCKNHENIIVSVDTVLAISQLRISSSQVKTKNVILHLSDSPDINNVSKILWNDMKTFLIKHPEYSCTIITDHFSGGQKRSFDYFENISKKNIQVKTYKYTETEELIDIIKSSDIVITNKLHVGIVGISFDKNVISVPNHPKVKNLFKQLCIEENLLDKNLIKENQLLVLLEKHKDFEFKLNDSVKKQALVNLVEFEDFITKETK